MKPPKTKSNACPLPQHLGEKLKQIREAKGFSQESMAHALKCSRVTISHIENGKVEVNDETLLVAKKFLEIENAPLFEHELNVFESRLLTTNELIDEGRLPEAGDMLKNLSVILCLPYEKNYIFFYKMTEVRLFTRRGELSRAEELVIASEELLDNASLEAKHLYHRNMGVCIFNRLHHKDCKTALKHFQKALEMGCGKLVFDPMLYVQIGATLMEYGKPIRAIIYYEQAIMAYGGRRSNVSTLAYSNLCLVECLFFIGELQRAKKLINEVLELTVNTEHKLHYALALTKMAYIHQQMGDPKEGLKIIEQAIVQANDDISTFNGKIYYGMKLNIKAICLLDMKKYKESSAVAEEGKRLVQGNERKEMIFEAINKLTNLRDSESIDYIENIAIPRLCATNYTGSLYEALNLCERLKIHYKKRRAEKKAAIMGDMAGEIFRKIIVGPTDIE